MILRGGVAIKSAAPSVHQQHQIIIEVGLPEDYQKEYHGENDKLVRTSAAPSSKRSNVNFVSVDLLNEYLAFIFGNSQEGKSIDAFVNNKNALNCDERGEVAMISKKNF